MDMRALSSVIVAALISASIPLTSNATDGCGQAALKNEHKDAATIQVLERAWSVAFRQGDTDFERCLLTPDFTEIGSDGKLDVLVDELKFAADNLGKNLPIPPQPPTTVLIHGDVAVAYVEVSHSKDGKSFSVYNADYYIWEGGAWHAYFSQQSRFGG